MRNSELARAASASEPVPRVSPTSWAASGLVAFALALALLAGCAPEPPITARADLEGQRPSATVEMSQAQVAFIGSADAGTGSLHFQGRDYPFSVAGLGVGGIGASTIEAEGAVYHLSSAEAFGGAYDQGRYGLVVGNASRGDLWLENNAGVVMHLRARREGLMLSLGGDGVLISLRQRAP